MRRIRYWSSVCISISKRKHESRVGRFQYWRCTSGSEASAIFLDATKEESIKEAVEFTVNAYGSLTIMFNNVGGTNLKKDLDVVNMDLDEWDRLMNMNLKSVLIGARFAIPHMQKEGGGSIINTASTAAIAGDSICSAYGAYGTAVTGLTRYIATQYGKDKIRCNAIAPGLILTPAAKRSLPDEVREIFMKYNALPYHGEPEDIGNTVLFLASDDSKFMTGQLLVVDGGHYMTSPTISDVAEYAANLQK